MLPDIDLDQERFDDILENARNRIVSSYPDWTDFNYHDPGITMLEMFAWLKEIQQYYMNQISPAHYQKYLKLLGIRRCTKQPSRTEVSVRFGEDLVAARGTRLFAGNICFEAQERTYISASRICCCICGSDSRQRIIEPGELSFGGNLRIHPFPDKTGGEFYIGFDKPLTEGEMHRLYLEINDFGEVKRNPITDPDSFIRLADICAEYSTHGGWETLTCEDETYGFLTSGIIRFTPEHKHTETTVAGKKACFIRFRLTGGEYDLPPLIRSLSFNLLPVVQRETLAECVDVPVSEEVELFSELSVRGRTKVFLRDEHGLFRRAGSFEKRIDEETGRVLLRVPDTEGAVGIRVINLDPSLPNDGEIGFGTGLPFQEFDLETDQLEDEGFTLMSELPASGGRFVEWKKVDDFSTSRAEDFVYVLHTDTGILEFGDCIRGMAPEGRIFLVGGSRTLGANGNVSVGKIDAMEGVDESEISITNPRRSEGGQNEETAEQCFSRAYRLIQTTEAPVTDEDHYRFILGIQGLKLETCQFLRTDPAAVQRRDPIRLIVVKPYSPDGRGVPGERYCRNILAALERKRLLCTGFRIVRPEYAPVQVYADLMVERSATQAKEDIERLIREYFRDYHNRFGAKLIYSQLYERLNRQPYVIAIHALTIETQGSGAERTREGDLVLSPNVMAYLKSVDLILSSGR